MEFNPNETFIANRDPSKEDFPHCRFWLNYKSKEFFEFIIGDWHSLSKEYLQRLVDDESQ